MSKKRAPIDQLREAGKIARQMLQDKGIEARKSVLDEIVKKKETVLPGIPVYLPHQWTLKAAQRILYDILLMWKDDCKGDEVRAENITEFWKFLITQLREQEKDFAKDVKNQPQFVKSLKEIPVLKDVFAPVRKLENIKAIQRFFVDSFAVSMVLKNNHSTSEFANWFLDWTQDMYKLFLKPKDRDKVPVV